MGEVLDTIRALQVWPRKVWVLSVGFGGLAFAGFATITSWQALSDRRGLDLPLRTVAVVGIVMGCLLWSRSGNGPGPWIAVTAIAFFARDLRASDNDAVFAAGFCLAYGWLGFAAQTIISWPAGRLQGRVQRLLVGTCYVLAVGSQIGRYVVDRPQPGWLNNHPPDTLWAHIGSACAATMAIVVAAYVAWWWSKSSSSRRAAEPVWLVFVIVTVSAASAAVASIAGVPDGQIELVPAALALTMGLPTGWLYARMNAQLQEVSASRVQIAAALEEVRTSRRRVSVAALEERRRIQADLHDGAQQSLAAVQLRLASALNTSKATWRAEGKVQPELVRAYQELTVAISSLRDLVQQIYPVVLREYGLMAALEDLADRSTIPLLLDVPAKRWPREVEVTAYFVISEAVGNSMRHAQPNQITVRVLDQETHLRVQIDDDGRGQALPLDQGGLAGLHDRVDAAGGTAEMSSNPNAGTHIIVLLPKETPHARRSS